MADTESNQGWHVQKGRLAHCKVLPSVRVKEWRFGTVSIKAIPTTYNGIKMRSRLEASFAQALDSFGIEWVYEAEGFDIDGVWYLPDFWIPKFKAFVEVKGVLDDSVEKPRRLSGLIGDRRVFLATPEHVASWQISESPQLLHLSTDAWRDRNAVLARCGVCGLIDIHSSKCCLKIYMAGKVLGVDDWRLGVSPSLKSGMREGTNWHQMSISKFYKGKHVYTGPFFRMQPRTVAEDWDGGDRNSHLADTTICKAHDGTDIIRGITFESCMRAIERSDLVFAWITDRSAYGTLVEIGAAEAMGKQVAVCGDIPDDLWFAQKAASIHPISEGLIPSLDEAIRIASMNIPLRIKD